MRDDTCPDSECFHNTRPARSHWHRDSPKDGVYQWKRSWDNSWKKRYIYPADPLQRPKELSET